MRTEIALLQNVRVASPCHASWDDMTPIDHDRVRFCDGCQKRVYNLSAMGQAEAEGLLRGHEGHLCVRYYRRHDGTILTSDCPIGLRAARQLILTRTRVSIRPVHHIVRRPCSPSRHDPNCNGRPDDRPRGVIDCHAGAGYWRHTNHSHRGSRGKDQIISRRF